MEEEQIELDIKNSPLGLLHIISCIQRGNIQIRTFIAEEKNADAGLIRINIVTDKEQLKKLVTELESLDEVNKIVTKGVSRPSSELSDIYEE